jgi:hypothetical protein
MTLFDHITANNKNVHAHSEALMLALNGCTPFLLNTGWFSTYWEQLPHGILQRIFPYFLENPELSRQNRILHVLFHIGAHGAILSVLTSVFNPISSANYRNHRNNAILTFWSIFLIILTFSGWFEPVNPTDMQRG